MTPSDVSVPPELVVAVVRFRSALERLTTDYPGLARFPRGSCGDACELLGEYLSDAGLGRWTYKCGWDSEERRRSHAWLEQDEIIIDITADQFDDLDAPPTIVSLDREWHRKNYPIVEGRRHAGLSYWDGPSHHTMQLIYEELRSAANPPTFDSDGS